MSSKSVMDRVAELGPQVNHFICSKIRDYEPDLSRQTMDQAIEQDIAVSILCLESLLAAQKATAAAMGINYLNALN